MLTDAVNIELSLIDFDAISLCSNKGGIDTGIDMPICNAIHTVATATAVAEPGNELLK